MNTDIEAILATCNRHPEIVVVYLFGSRATGEADDRSDYDVAVLCEKGLSPERYGMLQVTLNGELTVALKCDAVDVVVMNCVTNIELLFAIIQDGQRLMDRGDDTDEYEMRRRHEYEDHIRTLKRAGYLIQPGRIDGTQ